MTSTQPSDPRLVWPRTDGSSDRWPAVNEPSSNGTYYVPLEEGHRKYDTYEEAAGEHLAGILGIAPLAGKRKHRIPMPQGFKLYIHKQPRSNGEIREDYYCFGSTRGGSRIRSAQEWKDHAEWLFDTSKSFENHNEDCGCMRKLKKTGSTAGTPTVAKTASVKRAAPAAAPTVKRPRPKPRMSPESDDEFAATGVVPDRASDLGSQRRFRRGELVWFCIDAIDPPTPAHPAITHWPGLIAEIKHKSREAPAVNANGTGSFANGGMVHHYWEYNLRPLGLFDKRFDTTRDIQDLLPWCIGLDLLGGDPGRRALAQVGSAYMSRGIDKEVKEDEESSAEKRWSGKWVERKPFDAKTLSQNWDETVFRLVIAIRIGANISQSWCQTDRVDAIPESILSLADRDALNKNQKSLFQGLWLGGERIWAEDVVRIKKRRDALPSGLAPIGVGTRATERAIFLRIQTIALELLPPNEADPKQETWRCLVYGDLAELIPAPFGADEAGDSGWAQYSPTSGLSQPLVHNYKAPKGFAFRQINPDDSQITCDIGDIAGRMYPDLIDESTQTWYGVRPPRAPAGPKAIAAMGLAPGDVACSENIAWAEDLFAIVNRASNKIEQDFLQYYSNELRTRMKRDPAKKPEGWKRPAAPVSRPSSSSAVTAPASKAPEPEKSNTDVQMDKSGSAGEADTNAAPPAASAGDQSADKPTEAPPAPTLNGQNASTAAPDNINAPAPAQASAHAAAST